MGVFSNDLAPNLFESYTDWYDNWVRETGKSPEKDVDDMACRYFDALEYDTEMVCARCGHHLGYIKGSKKRHAKDPIEGVKDDKETCTFLCDLCRETIAENAMFCNVESARKYSKTVSDLKNVVRKFYADTKIDADLLFKYVLEDQKEADNDL